MSYINQKGLDVSIQSNTRAAKIKNQLRAIHINYQPQAELMSSLDYMMQCVEFKSDDIFPGLRCFVAEGSGKSYIAKKFAEAVNGRYPDQKRVVYFPLKTAKRNKSVLANLIEKFGNDRWKPNARESTDRLELMLQDIISANNTLLIIFDEVGNVNYKDSFNTEFAILVKTILNENWASVALLGTPDAYNIIRPTREMRRRIKNVCDFPPLTNSPEDLLFVKASMEQVDREIQEMGIFGSSSCIASGDVVLGLIEVSRGGLGYIIDVVKEAVVVACRRGRDHIEIDDLALAVDQWLIKNELIASNPFRRAA